MSETTTLVIEVLKTLGKDRADDGIILSLRNRLPEEEKKKMLEEATKFYKEEFHTVNKNQHCEKCSSGRQNLDQFSPVSSKRTTKISRK